MAILAELVQLRACGALAAVPARPAAGSAKRPAKPIDPVCGMTVTVEPSGRPVSRDGVDYYFCCAGCRRAFEEDPGAYVKRETRC